MNLMKSEFDIICQVGADKWETIRPLVKLLLIRDPHSIPISEVLSFYSNLVPHIVPDQITPKGELPAAVQRQLQDAEIMFGPIADLANVVDYAEDDFPEKIQSYIDEVEQFQSDYEHARLAVGHERGLVVALTEEELSEQHRRSVWPHDDFAIYSQGYKLSRAVNSKDKKGPVLL